MSMYKSLMLFLASTLVVPLGMMAAPRTPTPMTTTTSSQDPALTKEATGLLKDVEAQAFQIRTAIGPYDYWSRADQTDWQSLSDVLTYVKDDVNTMGKDLKRLAEIRSSLEPWQQKEIGRVTPIAVEMANRTQQAIQLLNNSEVAFWATKEPADLTAIRQDAGKVSRSVGKVVQLAHLHKDIQAFDHQS